MEDFSTIRKFDPTSSDEEFQNFWFMWHTVFGEWQIGARRMQKFMKVLPGHHFNHRHGFCLSWLDGTKRNIAVVAVLPEARRMGLGSALLKAAEEELRKVARENGDAELKSLEIGSSAPRFWPGVPIDFPQEVKDFFLHAGFQKKAGPTVRDYFNDIRTETVPAEILERVSKSDLKFSPLTPELYEECIAKQKANKFPWVRGSEILAAYNEHHEALVAFDPETNEQIGWKFMCSHEAIISQYFAFMPLLPSKEKTGLIAAVGVDRSARGKGVGLALMVKAIENMRERGIEGVFIDSTLNCATGFLREARIQGVLGV